MDTIFFVQDLDELNEIIKKDSDMVNKGFRQRTATLQISKTDFDKKENMILAGGESVCNSYGYSASTTTIGLAFVTIENGKLCRLDCKRQRSGNNRQKLPFGYNTARTRLNKATPKDIILSKLEELVMNDLKVAENTFGKLNLDCDHLLVIADWLEERDHQHQNIRFYSKLKENLTKQTQAV